MNIALGDYLLCILQGHPDDKFTVGKIYRLEYINQITLKWPYQIYNDLDKIIQFTYDEVRGIEDVGANVPLFYPMKLIQNKDKFLFAYRMTGKIPK